MYVKSNEPGKTWSCCVIRTHRGIFAVAQEGVHKTNDGPCGLESFSFAMFGDRRIETKLDAKRLTAKVEREGLAKIAAMAAAVPAKAPVVLPADRPALYVAVGIDPPMKPMPLDDFTKMLEHRGFYTDGKSAVDGPLRVELKARPQFKGLAGPMWGGTSPDGLPIIRYETWEANRALSA
jgi:hypothetical protein